MRKISIVGLLVIVLVGAGLTVAWVRSPSVLVQATGVAAVAQTSSAATTATTTSVDQTITDSGENAVKQAIAAVGPAVVRIDVTEKVSAGSSFFNDPYFQQYFGTPQTQETQGVGSGFIISYGNDKYVLTNAHVVADTTSIKVIDATGKSWDAEIVGSDDVVDAAVLRVKGDASLLPTATLGDSDKV